MDEKALRSYLDDGMPVEGYQQFMAQHAAWAFQNLDFIREIGMMTHLAQTRSNGLLAMVRQMKNYALAYQLKNKL